LRYRPPRKITHRVSSVTNGFVQAIIPQTVPSRTEHAPVLAILKIDPDDLTCAYCGAAASEWDHLNPYVQAKRPSGFLNEARNLVPACGPCNASKSGKPWKTWLQGNARGSPNTRGVADIDLRAERLDRLEAELRLQPIDLSKLVEPELWASYWKRREDIERMLFEAQEEAVKIRQQISDALSPKG
jgi:hypothetical protein